MIKKLSVTMLCLVAAIASAEKLDFNNKEFQVAVRRTNGSAVVEKETLQVFSMEPQKNGTVVVCALPFATDGVAGKTVMISAEISLDQLSVPEAAWAGPKLMIETMEKNGLKYYNFYTLKQQSGKMDWTKTSRTVTIPDDARDPKLVLGMQGQKGTILFRNVEIEVK